MCNFTWKTFLDKKNVRKVHFSTHARAFLNNLYLFEFFVLLLFFISLLYCDCLLSSKGINLKLRIWNFSFDRFFNSGYFEVVILLDRLAWKFCFQWKPDCWLTNCEIVVCRVFGNVGRFFFCCCCCCLYWNVFGSKVMAGMKGLSWLN